MIGNDSGLFHMAAAIGTPTVRLFGPTSHLSLGQFSPNVQVLRAGLACEPCWFGALPMFQVDMNFPSGLIVSWRG